MQTLRLIMDWEYENEYEPGYFDIIWASPPCTQYSVAKTIGTRDIEGSNKVVQKNLRHHKLFPAKMVDDRESSNRSTQTPTNDAEPSLL